MNPREFSCSSLGTRSSFSSNLPAKKQRCSEGGYKTLVTPSDFRAIKTKKKIETSNIYLTYVTVYICIQGGNLCIALSLQVLKNIKHYTNAEDF